MKHETNLEVKNSLILINIEVIIFLTYHLRFVIEEVLHYIKELYKFSQK